MLSENHNNEAVNVIYSPVLLCLAVPIERYIKWLAVEFRAGGGSPPIYMYAQIQSQTAACEHRYTKMKIEEIESARFDSQS